jgi:hypothetical protein
MSIKQPQAAVEGRYRPDAVGKGRRRIFFIFNPFLKLFLKITLLQNYFQN